ncbi:ABC transporter substrate-binding protein [Paenibacillus paridis]|uniref:ABC transporter substrate-binding protein n=1 Tax=Paenibacillus paridis TaxID=2583376 RepID=UPI001121F09A|nr:sugar ABC transporter substrate-binding protein [Paenibacillus paridis]
MKKRVGFTLSLLLVAGMLAGCASGKNSGENSKEGVNANGGGKQISLKFSIWGNDTHKQMYDTMIEKYREDHPNINVEIMTIPATDYQQKLSVMMASKTAPDIMWMMERAIPQFLGAGQLADLSSLKTDASYQFDDLYPSTLDLLSKDDKIYGIPFSTPPNMIYYNQSLFESKGLKTPKELYSEGKWTYDEMVKAAEAIAVPDQGLYGINLIRPNGWTTSWIESLQTLVWAYGADYFSEDGKQFALNSPEGEQAIQFFSDAMFKTRIHPKPGDQTTFETGKIGMQQELFSYMGKAKAITDFKWDIAPMPSGAGGQGVTLGYAGYVVTEGSPHQAEAIEFVKYLTNQENMTVTSQFFVPSRKSVLESDAFLNQGPSPESVKTAVLEQIGKGKVRQAFTNFQKIDEKMKIGFDSIYTQSVSVPDFLSHLEKEVTPVLNP